MTDRLEKPDEMALRLVAQSESTSVETIGIVVDTLLNSIIVPPLAPFLVAWAVISVPMERLQKRLGRGSRRMPLEWLVSVEALAGDDGRFFVGRVLKQKGHATMDDAIRFVAIERTAPQRTGGTGPGMSVDDARAALVAHYDANRTLFDKAVAATGDALGQAVNLSVVAGFSAARAIKHKLDKGF